MKTYTYSVFAPTLKKTFIHSDKFASDHAFRLFAYSLYSANWSLISVR